MKFASAKRICALALAALTCAVILFTALPVGAADGVSKVYYNGQSGFSFDPSSKDLFVNFKGIVPGDELVQTIEITNKTNESNVPIYMNAVRTTEQIPTGFLSQLTLTVEVARNNGTTESSTTALWYDGDAGKSHLTPESGKPDMSYTSDQNDPTAAHTRRLVAEFGANETVTVTVKITVPFELSDEYQNAAGTIYWEFFVPETTPPEESTTTTTATTTTTPPPPVTFPVTYPVTYPTTSIVVSIETPVPQATVPAATAPSTTVPATTIPQTVDIEPPEIPEAPASSAPVTEAGIEIPDILTPLGGLIPQTGDEAIVFFWCLSAIVLTLAIVVLSAIRRRRREK